jgi:thiosulfate dehydrogenase [quinone] large subunit
MTHKFLFTKPQITLLLLLRLIVGYHFLFEGIDKLFTPNWTAAPFLLQANWVFSNIFHWLTGNTAVLSVINFLNIWGQILIGLSLILGLFSTSAAIFGALMMLSYYIAVPPFVSASTFVDKNLFELVSFLIIALFPTSDIIGIDFLMKKLKGNEDG